MINGCKKVKSFKTTKIFKNKNWFWFKNNNRKIFEDSSAVFKFDKLDEDIYQICHKSHKK